MAAAAVVAAAVAAAAVAVAAVGVGVATGDATQRISSCHIYYKNIQST